MDSVKSFEQRLSRLMQAANITKEAELARILKINQSSIAAARKRQQLPPGWVETIAEEFRVSANWLFFSQGNMRLDEAGNNTSSASPLVASCAQCDVDIIMVPMANARLSAGSGSLEIDDTSERKYAFRSDFLFRKGNPDNMILMRVLGDSMSPEIENNDVVLLDQSKKGIVVGTLYAVGFEDAIYLKRIDKLPGKIVLKSTNTAYPPVEIDINGDCESLFRVIGRVLWCGREYK